MKSRELIREIESAGWILVRIRGSHHQFRHPRETLTYSPRLRHCQRPEVKARLCRRIGHTSKSRNAEIGELATPQRAGPVASICGVAVLEKATSLPAHSALQLDATGPAEARRIGQRFPGPGTVTVPHPKKDLGKGIVRKIRKDAGLG